MTDKERLQLILDFYENGKTPWIIKLVQRIKKILWK